MNNNPDIKVIDSIMGSGKSTFAINYINDNPDKDFIVVLPTLSEIDRYKKGLERHVYIPNEDSDSITLQAGFQSASYKGDTILTTHALLERWDKITTDIIIKKDYVLILDEIVDVVHSIGITQNDFDMLMNEGYVFLHEDNGMQQVIVDDKKDYEGNLSKFYNHTKYNSVYRVLDEENKTNNFCVWLTPPEKLSSFKEVLILTYLFKGSEMSTWLKIFHHDYSLHSIFNGKLIKHTLGNPEQFKHLISIIDDKSKNRIGHHFKSLSLGWYEKSTKANIDTIKKNTRAVFRSSTKSEPYDNAFTVFKGYKPKMEQHPYKQVRNISLSSYKGMSSEQKAKIDCFIPINSKGTNNFKHKKYLAYLVNRYPNPRINDFFKSIGYELNADLYGLSELIQWVWRSQIREGKPITLYIPSRRMRQLLFAWLSGKDASVMTRAELDEMDKELRLYNKVQIEQAA